MKTYKDNRAKVAIFGSLHLLSFFVFTQFLSENRFTLDPRIALANYFHVPSGLVKFCRKRSRISILYYYLKQ